MRDCLVVGAGPAGLTAAVYLARFHLKVAVIDAGGSRAALIPLTRNHAGFPEGISGVDLLQRMRSQALQYDADVRDGTVERLELQADGSFAVRTDRGLVLARSVLLATGVVNRRPPMIDDATHRDALAGGQLRYCPICDGYEVTDRKVVVMGTGQRGCDEALFLRSYTADVTLVPPGAAHELSPEQMTLLAEAGISIAGPCSAIRLAGDRIALDLADGTHQFDSLYPALGSEIRSELARPVGAEMSDDGCLIVDDHQRTSVPGLYAAGDVVLGLDQISHAMGEGGVAATTIRNDLARRTPLRR
jgi:thioredoxin reductase (NADPH)